jgi:hypothetical protein
MKCSSRIIVAALVLAAITENSPSQNKKEPIAKRFVLIDCAPLNSDTVRDETGELWLELETLDGKKYGWYLSGMGPGRGEGEALVIIFANLLFANEWNYTRKGDRITIYSATDDKKQTSEIAKISLRTKNIAPMYLPRIFASKTVEVEQMRK